MVVPAVVNARVVSAKSPGAASPAGGAFARGVTAFRAGAYGDAEKILRGVVGKDVTSDGGWALYLHAESAFYSGALAAAAADFDKLSRARSSRFADVAPFRAADCQWASGVHVAAAEHYRRLLAHLPARTPQGVDPAVARFRVALDAEERHRPDAVRLFLALYRDLPAHPLATEARQHLKEPAVSPAASSDGDLANKEAARAAAAAGATDHLRRAETLSRDHHWAEALDELARLPPDLPPDLSVERDFQIGMTKFQMRRDYGKAAELLLKVAPSLSGDKAASALFHGTRALSRIDHDDEAIAGYKQVVARFPQSRYAAEAQFLSGWLDYNRGRYRESLPGLQGTLDHFGKSAFADDAAWCLAFAHFLVGQLPAAATELDRYARMPLTGMTAEERASRVAYWKARIDAKAQRLDQAKVGYREVNRRWPFSFYGVAARARLAELNEKAVPELTIRGGASAGGAGGGVAGGSATGTRLAPALTAKEEQKLASDPTLRRARDLAAAGLDVEAGWELQRDEKAFLQRWGEPRGTRLLLDRYPAWKAFRRAYEIGESRNGGALAAAPEADPGVRLWWQAAYPKAYRDLVDRYGPPAGNPDLLLYAIMRKESGFSPWDVSSADARGLLQMIPPTSARVAASENMDFFPDQLFDPEVNIRLGAAYIGGLSKKFAGQIPIIAGAFNAGPKAMAKWCDHHGHQSMDEFVELIAFTQTREYAKRVVAIFARYRHLYAAVPYQMPMTVNAQYAASGPDY